MSAALDLSTPEGRAAHRSALRAVAKPWRYAGFALVLAGAALLIAFRLNAGMSAELMGAGYLLLAAGWGLMIVAMFKRRQYQRRRLGGAGED